MSRRRRPLARQPRIGGLVAAATRVRERMAAGMDAEEREAIRDTIDGILVRVQTICQNQGGSTLDLPTPSRRAYEYLRDIDLDAIPLGAPNTSPLKKAKLPGVMALTDRIQYLLGRLCAGGDVEGYRTQVRQLLVEQDRRLRVQLVQPGIVAGSFAPLTRMAVQWLLWLARPGNVERHVAALQRAGPVSGADFQLYVFAYLVRGKGPGDVGPVTIVAHQAYVDAPASVLSNLIALGSGDKGPAATIIKDFACTDSFHRVLEELETVWPAAGTNARERRPGRGAAHDLDAAAARVIARYFADSPPEVSITWSKTPSIRRLGFYDFTRREIAVSMALDLPSVPTEVIDFIVYHELLHAVHGLRKSGRRRIAHTPAFRRDEKRFTGYSNVQRWLKAWGGTKGNRH